MRQNGFVLVPVLLVCAVVIVIIVDTMRRANDYTRTAAYFVEGERLSAIVRSGYMLSSNRAIELMREIGYVPKKDFEFTETVDDAKVLIRISDNNARLNLNKLVHGSGIANVAYTATFKRLLRSLAMDESIAERITDWIDPDSDPLTGGAEDKAKNCALFSLTELRYIVGDENAVKLTPFVTFFGNGMINVNTAPIQLVKALDENITDATANELVSKRTASPFDSREKIRDFPGIGNAIFQSISDRVDVKGNGFTVEISAGVDALKITADAAFEIVGEKAVTRYWRER